jgi:hypothetical protein
LPIRFSAVDFLVISEISERYFLHNKKMTPAAKAEGGNKRKTEEKNNGKRNESM